MSEKNYHALIPDKIFMGAAADVESMVKNEGIDVVVDLRGEATECAFAFHCGAGKGRTGTVVAGTLLALGLSDTLDEAEAKAKSIRTVIDMKPSQRESLNTLYPCK